MPAEIPKPTDHLVPTSFSASIIAETGYIDLRTNKIILVRQKDSKKWGLPAGHTLYKPNEFLEHPQQTVLREWGEETGGIELPHKRNPPRLEMVTSSYDQREGKASVGFVFGIEISDSFVRRNFKQNPNDPLTYFPRGINSQFETDMVGAFDSRQIATILLNWRKLVYRPEINGDILLNWYNYLLDDYSGLYTIGANWKIQRSKLEFDWEPRVVVWKSKQEP